jgi:hypothetical protein
MAKRSQARVGAKGEATGASGNGHFQPARKHNRRQAPLARILQAARRPRILRSRPGNRRLLFPCLRSPQQHISFARVSVGGNAGQSLHGRHCLEGSACSAVPVLGNTRNRGNHSEGCEYALHVFNSLRKPHPQSDRKNINGQASLERRVAATRILDRPQASSRLNGVPLVGVLAVDDDEGWVERLVETESYAPGVSAFKIHEQGRAITERVTGLTGLRVIELCSLRALDAVAPLDARVGCAMKLMQRYPWPIVLGMGMRLGRLGASDA